MNIFSKKTTLFSAALCASFIFSSNASASEPIWRGINIAGGAGSVASAVFWAGEAFKHPSGILGIIPRLLVDSTCVWASVRNEQEKTNFSILHNAACLLGSTFSLGLWTPAIIAHCNTPLYLARGIIDALQIVLTAKRLYSYYDNPQIGLTG